MLPSLRSPFWRIRKRPQRHNYFAGEGKMMKFNLQMVCLAIAIGAILLPAASVRAQSAAPTGNADNGHKLFDTVGCFQCHGYAGQGGSAGPELAKTKLPLDAFLMQVRKPSNQMPPYEAVVLPDQAASDIYAYIQSLPGPVDMQTITLPH
jgi:mono/diheme cytochrome c family protein